MRAAVLVGTNQPWVIRDLPDPVPTDGQVLIRVRASGMCGTDLHVHHGVFPVPLPLVIGHEPVGEIAALGPGVTGLKIGDRVGVCWAQKGCGRCAHCQEHRIVYCPDQQSWMNLGGGNGERMLAWAEGCTLLPKDLAWEEAAPIFCAGFTVYSGLRNAHPRPGERVAVLGIGGLGHLAVQYAKALGLETFAVTGSAAKAAEAKAFGADEVVVGGDDPGKALTDAGGADIILGTTNSARQASSAARALRPEGRMVNMGLLDGPLQLDSAELLMKQAVVRGSMQNERRDLVEALAWVARGKVRPKLEVYGLDDINRVRERLEQGQVRYRAVIRHAA